jgi:hypothetical protein
MAARKHAASKIYELYVELEDIEPLIWRRLLVPATITLPTLHDLLQLAMGWTNSHLHSFTFGKQVTHIGVRSCIRARGVGLQDLTPPVVTRQSLKVARALGVRLSAHPI